MDVEKRIKPSAGMSGDPFRKRLSLGVDEFGVVAIVVVGRTVLALIACLHAVIVHHRHAHQLDVLAEPFAEVVVRHERVRDSLDNPARHRFGAVVTARDEEAELRLSGNASNAHARNVRSLARLAVHLDLHLARGNVCGMAREKRLPVREHIRMALVE